MMDGRLLGVIGSRAFWSVLLSLSIVMCTAGSSRGDETIGGVAYKDVANVLTTGETGVTMTITGTGSTTGTYTATTAGSQGLWQTNVPEGTYTVTPSKAGRKFWHMVGGKPDLQTSLAITVNQANRATNGSIQFLASNVGGTIFTDPAHPTTSGLSGVTVTLTPQPDGDAITTTTMATTTGVDGWWQIGVASGTYRVTPSLTGKTFAHVGDDLAYVDVTVSTANLEADTALQFKVVGPTPTKLAFTGQPGTSSQAGQTMTAQVTVQDAGGTTIDTSSASITLQLVPVAPTASATLYGTNPQSASGGVANFTDLAVRAPGTYKLHATATGLTPADSGQFVIAPAPAAALAFIASPGKTGANDILSPHPQVEIRDSFGNRVTTDSTSAVIVALVGSGTLNGTMTVNASQGVATFADLTVGTPGTFPSQFQLTATSGSLPTATSGSFQIFAPPVLRIGKTDSADPVDPNAAVTYTITYQNVGLGSASNTVIVETLPEHLVVDPSAITGGGSYNATARTITWTIGTLAAGANGTVTFAARFDSSLEDGGVVTNSALTIGCAETDAVQAAAETTTVRDKKAPVVTLTTPQADSRQVPIKNVVTLGIADHSGVDVATVKISIEGCLVYDGAHETSTGQYDSNNVQQVVRGVCRRTGTATNYTFTFIPSASLGYERKVAVRVDAADVVGNHASAPVEYSFWTQTRTFGKNARVNSYETLIQDNPATAADPTGRIWVVWDQTSTSGDGDIYLGLLPVDANSFEASVPVAASRSNERHPALAIDANGIAYVAWQAADPNRHWDIYVSHSTNGTTWSSPFKISGIGDPNNTSDQTSPALALGRGTSKAVYVAWEDNRSGNSDIWLATSTDQGATWTEAQITSDPANQTQPGIVVDPNNVVYVAWTDARNAATTGTDIYVAGSQTTPWTSHNEAIVNDAGNQSGLVGVASNRVYLAWVTDVGGFDKVLYASDVNEPPFHGTSILDAGEPSTVVLRMPTLAAHSVFGSDTVFAAWEDSRNVVSGNGDTDIYFAEGGSSFGTNVLVNDDTGTSTQTKPALGVNRNGDPYLVWVDNREGNNDIYYAGATAIQDNHNLAKQTTVDANGVVTVHCQEKAHLELIIPDVNALPAGVEPNDISMSEVTNPPALPQNGFGLCYDFGPNGIVFSSPLTMHVPLATGYPVYPEYNVYRYDPSTLSWTTSGILNPAKRITGTSGDYLEVQISHFSTFATGGVPADNGGGGGCALAPWGNANPVEYGLPFVAYVLVLLGITYLDSRRRRAGADRRP